MRTFCHGKDKGGALAGALILILVLSTITVSATQYIYTKQNLYIRESDRTHALIQANNAQAEALYDAH